MRGPYTIQALEQHPENRAEYRAVGEPETYAQQGDARKAAKRAYHRTGVIPAVFDESGRTAHLLTNEEVGTWGLDEPELL